MKSHGSSRGRRKQTGALRVEQVLERREAAIPLKQQAVLFRASNHSAVLELELVRRNIPM